MGACPVGAQAAVAGRIRNAEERLRRLLADPVPKPPEPLSFTLTPSSEGGDDER